MTILRKSEIPQFKDTFGWASYLQGDYRNAVSLSEKATTALPDQAALLYHLGMSYYCDVPVPQGMQLKRALELVPDEKLERKIRSALEQAKS